jgi:hypothetical protein
MSDERNTSEAHGEADPDDLGKLKQELKASLDVETKRVDRQIVLLSEQRDLKVALENAQVEAQLARLQAERAKLVATKAANV